MSRRYRVKICGLTDLEQVQVAVAAGADAIGLVLVPGSRRRVDYATAARLAQALPPFVTSVALLVNPREAEVDAVLEQVRPDVLQFHGEESGVFCQRFGWPYLKAIAMGAGGVDPRRVMDDHPQAQGFLLDSHHQGMMGGSGEVFAWSSIPADLGRPWLLAGGLDAQNVGAALQQTRPYGVDVSSGVESRPGYKDAQRIKAFIRAVREMESV